jgi:hypothetical protein
MVYIAPSGWTKSTYFRLLLKNGDGIVWNNDKMFPTDLHSSFTPASWFGTIRESKDKDTEQKEGIFTRYKRGIVGADDYQALTLLFDEGVGEDERALMTALDTDEAVKNLSLGQIRVKDVGVTMWFGIRPAEVNLTSGLARRFQFPRFYPTRKEADIFRTMARKQVETCMDLEPTTVEGGQPPMLGVFNDTYEYIVNRGVTEIDYGPVDDWLSQYRLPHFEENIYRKLATGYAVATGSYPKIVIESELEEMLMDEIVSRESLRTDPYRLMFHRIISAEDGNQIGYTDLLYYLTMFLQFSENEARKMITKEKRDRRLTLIGTRKRLEDAKLELNWEPTYIEDLEV